MRRQRYKRAPVAVATNVGPRRLLRHRAALLRRSGPVTCSKLGLVVAIAFWISASGASAARPPKRHHTAAQPKSLISVLECANSASFVVARYDPTHARLWRAVPYNVSFTGPQPRFGCPLYNSSLPAHAYRDEFDRHYARLAVNLDSGTGAGTEVGIMTPTGAFMNVTQERSRNAFADAPHDTSAAFQPLSGAFTFATGNYDIVTQDAHGTLHTLLGGGSGPNGYFWIGATVVPFTAGNDILLPVPAFPGTVVDIGVGLNDEPVLVFQTGTGNRQVTLPHTCLPTDWVSPTELMCQGSNADHEIRLLKLNTDLTAVVSMTDLLPPNQRGNGYATVSPDGRHFAFFSTAGGSDAGLFEGNLNGIGRPRKIASISPTSIVLGWEAP